MKVKFILFAMAFLGANMLSAAPKEDNKLSRKEKRAGWVLLFDGKTFDGWRTHANKAMTDAGWTIEDGCLKAEWQEKGNKNILTKNEYDNFEISVDWKLSPQGNSGIMYHQGDEFTEGKPSVGPEYQFIDDLDYPSEITPLNSTGADYDMMPPSATKKLKPVGEFNNTRIVFNKGHVEHWLNGEKILEFEAWTPEWKERISKSKWKDTPTYGALRKGAFMFQNYPGSKVWLKNIKLKQL